MELLSARSDYIFKLIFADERNINCLKDFLQAVLRLGDDEFKDIHITDPFLQKESAEDKLGILDVKLETTSGHIIDIEVQLWSLPDMRGRVTYYLSKMVTEQLGAGSPYSDLRRAISIVIVDFPLITETDSHHTTFQMLERTEHFPFNDLTEINVLDLTKIPENQSDDLVNWMKFLKAEREEEFEMLARQNPQINQAYAFLRELSADEATRLRNESRLKAKRDEWSRLAGAKLEGIEEGRVEGRAEERADIVHAMARKGKSASEIADLIDMPQMQVETFLRRF
jgi:predicted transposase/invertase (TIGR01784 family)